MSHSRARFVVDTGVVISAILRSKSIPAEALRLAHRCGTVIVSEATITELHTVLTKPSLARYIDPERAAAVVRAYCATAEWIAVTTDVQACRDADDDKFLALATSGGADFIITGDEDLLVLHPFQGVDILSPRAFYDLFAEAKMALERQWLEESTEAIEAHNERIAKVGPLIRPAWLDEEN